MTAKEYKAHLRQRIKELTELNEAYRKEVTELREDRNKYREHFMKRFKWFLKLVGTNESPKLSEENGVIARDARFLQTVEYFSW